VRFRWPLPLAIAALMAVPASAADQSVSALPSTQFSPDDVTIDMGDTVTWHNEGGGFHNVKFNDGSFEQPPQPSSEPWTVPRTFDTPGIFRYVCGFHGSAMPGVVRVRDATGQVPVSGPGLDVSAPDEQTLTRLENRGLRARASCENGCDITLKVSLSPKTAKRFGFAKRRKTIGRESDSLSAGRTVPFDIDLKPKAANALADAKRAFKVRLDVRATNDTADTARQKIKITP
jgi:plastocyanin